jgi:tRNA(Ser,Leu) C12 N-acetylase TAN1
MLVLLTTQRGLARYTLDEIRELGKFELTEFRDVIKGEVESLNGFLEEVDKRPFIAIGKIVPIERSFHFVPERVLEAFKKEVEPLIDRIKLGESFCVKVTRRGLKGVFSSQELAKEVGTFVWTTLKDKYGVEPKVDLEDPDKAIVFETLGTWCGVGVISREDRKKYYYLHW